MTPIIEKGRSSFPEVFSTFLQPQTPGPTDSVGCDLGPISWHTVHPATQTPSLLKTTLSCASMEPCCCSVAKSCPTFCDPMDGSKPGFPVLHYLPEFAQTHIHWVAECHPTISSSIAPFSSCPQSFPAWGSFPMSQFFASDGQSIGASASISNEYSGMISFRIDWFDPAVQGTLVFSSTTAQMHQFFGTLPSLWSNAHIHIWLLENFPWLDLCHLSAFFLTFQFSNSLYWILCIKILGVISVFLIRLCFSNLNMLPFAYHFSDYLFLLY